MFQNVSIELIERIEALERRLEKNEFTLPFTFAMRRHRFPRLHTMPCKEEENKVKNMINSVREPNKHGRRTELIEPLK